MAQLHRTAIDTGMHVHVVAHTRKPSQGDSRQETAKPLRRLPAVARWSISPTTWSWSGATTTRSASRRRRPVRARPGAQRGQAAPRRFHGVREALDGSRLLSVRGRVGIGPSALCERLIMYGKLHSTCFTGSMYWVVARRLRGLGLRNRVRGRQGVRGTQRNSVGRYIQLRLEGSGVGNSVSLPDRSAQPIPIRRRPANGARGSIPLPDRELRNLPRDARHDGSTRLPAPMGSPEAPLWLRTKEDRAVRQSDSSPTVRQQSDGSPSQSDQK